MASTKENERFRLAFEFAHEGRGITDLAGNILASNEAFANLFGFTETELKSMNLVELWAPEDRPRVLADLKYADDGARFKSVFEGRYFNNQGGLLFAEVTRGLARNRLGKPLYFTLSVRDITKFKVMQEKLEAQASSDSLTGAMNRHFFEERAKFELMRSERYGDELSLVMIDLDHFKAINDSHGHLAGDRVLSGFCELAKTCMRSVDMLCRWGGEEFVILLTETGPGGAQLFAERLRGKLESRRFEKGIQATASMGVAAHRCDEGLACLVGRADACLYRAKQSGRNRVEVDPDDAKRPVVSKSQPKGLVVLPWKSSYKCGHPIIDAEHEELFFLGNCVVSTMTEGAGAARLLPLVRKLIAHIHAHLSNEERILKGVGFPEVWDHEESHRKLADRADQLASLFEKGQGSEVDLLRFLIYDVVSTHLLIEDKKFFPWFQSEPQSESAHDAADVGAKGTNTAPVLHS